MKRKIQERNLKEARLNVQKAEKKVQTAIKSAEKVTKEAGVAIRKLKKAYREEQKKRACQSMKLISTPLDVSQIKIPQKKRELPGCQIPHSSNS